MRRTSALFAGLLCTVGTARLHAQDSLSTTADLLRPGAKVRVDAPGIVGRRIARRVVALSRDSLVLRAQRSDSMLTEGSPAGRVALPLDRITYVGVSRGRSHGEGLLRGALWGTVIGVAFGAVATGPACHPACDPGVTRGEVVRKWTQFGAGVGTLVGLLVGREHWQQLDVPLRVSTHPDRAPSGERVASH